MVGNALCKMPRKFLSRTHYGNWYQLIPYYLSQHVDDSSLGMF